MLLTPQPATSRPSNTTTIGMRTRRRQLSAERDMSFLLGNCAMERRLAIRSCGRDTCEWAVWWPIEEKQDAAPVFYCAGCLRLKPRRIGAGRGRGGGGAPRHGGGAGGARGARGRRGSAKRRQRD